MNFLDMLRNNPRGWGNGAGPEPEIAYQDDGGNLYGFNNALLQKAPAPNQGFTDQSLTDMLIGIGSAPAKMATGLASGLSPYGSEGFQVPPLAADAWDAINAPGTILNEGMTPEDRDRTATNAAGFMMGGGLIAPKPTNTLGMFGGRMAKTADHNALAKAEDLASRGAPREQIWNETGWFQGPDQKWRFEIDDSKSWLADWGFGKAQKAGNVMQHKDMFDAYPDLREVPMQGTMSLDSAYNSGTDAMSVGMHKKNAALHEFQHAIQKREGFDAGGNVFSASASHPRVSEIGDQIGALEARASAATSIDEARAIDSQIRQLMAQQKQAKENLGYGSYQSLPGEVEARNVEARMNMSAEERRATPPWLTQDIADADQIVNLFSNGSKSGAGVGAGVVEGAKPIRAYRGSKTPEDVASAKDTYWATSNPETASDFAMMNEWPKQTHPNVSPVDVNFKNPLTINSNTPYDWLNVPYDGASRPWTNSVADKARELGHDGVIFKNIMEGTGDVPATTYAALQRGTVTSPLTGETLFSNGSKPGAAIGNSLVESQQGLTTEDILSMLGMR